MLAQLQHVDLVCKPAPLTGREFRYMRRHLLWTQAKASIVLGASGQQYISNREKEKSGKRFFSQIGTDFFWRYVCLEEFAAAASGSRAYQARAILAAFGTIREKLQKPSGPRRLTIRRAETSYGAIWESPHLLAA